MLELKSIALYVRNVTNNQMLELTKSIALYV